MSPTPPADPLPIWREPEFEQGVREMSGIALGIAAWGLVTGVAMAKSGMPPSLAVLMSLIVFAGSAQLATLPLIAAGAPVWVVWATAACVNLRFLVFSAGARPYFGHLPFWRRMQVGYFIADINFVVFTRRYPEPRRAPGQLAYFWGGVVTNWLAWQVPSLVGIFVGNHVPADWGIGFAGTLALVGLCWSLLGDRATWAAAAVAACAAVAAYSLPLRLNIVVAIAAAVAVGLLIDHSVPRTVKPENDLT